MISDEDTLFFTEESSLKSYINKESNKFEPRYFNVELMDDKLAFANFLVSIGEIPIPSRELKEIEDCYPFYLKCRHSWKDGKKLPRGFIVKNNAEVNKVIGEIKRNNWDVNWFFHQKLLNSITENNISTSGYFDYKNNDRNLIIISKKTLGDNTSMPTGVAVETIKEPSNLTQRTINLLNEIKYQGPFELEFLYEKKDNSYYILELNPRFWMQHGIFIDLYDNALIKRYLHKDKEGDWYENSVPPFHHIIWVDSIHFIYSLIQFRLNSIFNLLKLKGRKIFYPSISVAAGYCLRNIVNILANKIKK